MKEDNKMTKFRDLLDEAIKELEEEDTRAARESIKERLREIKESEKILAEMRKGLEKLLEEEI